MAKQCPKCGGTLVQRTNRNDGRSFLGCSGWRNGCRYTESIGSNGSNGSNVKPFIPSPEQQLIFDDVVGTNGHIIVNAGAGTGKSTTALNSITAFLARNPNATTIYTCFSKAIAKDFANRPDCPRGTMVSTMHSLGYQLIGNRVENMASKADQNKTADILSLLAGKDQSLDEIVSHKDKGESFVKAIVDLVRHCKNQMLDGTSKEDLLAIADRFGIDVNGNQDRAFALIPQILEMSKSYRVNDQLVIDFDDMIWLPLVLGFTFPSCDLVIVDEYQDLSPARQQFAMAIAGATGRIMVIGDEFQSIFGFAGADTDSTKSMTWLMQESGQDVSIRGLTFTRRVTKSGVAYINRHYPEIPFHAFPDAPDGAIEEIDATDIFEKIKPGDLLMSRVNAPLISLFFKLIKNKVRAAINGRQDDVEALLSAIRKLKARTIPQLLEKAEKSRAKELSRLNKSPKPSVHMIEACNDKYDVITEIARACSSIAEIEPTIKNMFADISGPNKRDRVLLSSVHRAKGLEAENTFVLQANMPHPKAATPEEQKQERNVWYVAHTRHKDTMYLVY